LRVTFDTNTFDKVVRPSVYPNDPSYPDLVVVHEALKRGDVVGFISETIITLEGLGKDQRAVVLGTTDLQRRTEQVSEDKFVITLTTEQAARQPLHPKQAERFVAAFDFGLRLLGTARIAMPRVEGDFYAFELPEALGERINRFHNIMRAIEARGLGLPRAMSIADRWADRAARNEPWYRVLSKAKDIHETREVGRAVAEWSDADSVGAHYAYDNNLFCTLDVAAGEGRRGDPAIFDTDNREWLSSNFGIKFGSITDLAKEVSAMTGTQANAMAIWPNIKKRLQELSRWDQLRKWGSSQLVRSSLAFFAAGYLLVWNAKFQDFLTIKFDGHFSLWRIWMIYYGAISLAVATLLYSVFCPKPIKDHGTAFDLADSECEYLATMDLGNQYLGDVRQLENDCTPAERLLWPAAGRPADSSITSVRGSANEPRVLAALIVYAWRVHNIRYPRLRPWILVLYSLGFLLLGIPAVVTFVQVTLAGIRSWFQ
jgi:hypothetical protein